MSLEQTLERIATAVEVIANEFKQTDVIQRPPPQFDATVTPGPPVAPVTETTPVVPATAQPGLYGPQAAPGPSAPATGPQVAAQPPASPPGPPAAPAAPAAPAMQVVPSLDDIRALATDFHRAHPERAAEVVGILASVNAQSLSEIPPDRYALVHTQLKALVGG